MPAPILVVDDDESYRDLLRCQLESVGYAVVEAGDGAVACKLASTQPLALVIVDMVMPVVDGLETIMHLRHQPYPVPIIAVSGAGRSEQYLRLALHLGANAKMEKFKPFTEMLSLVRNLVAAENQRSPYPPAVH